MGSGRDSRLFGRVEPNEGRVVGINLLKKGLSQLNFKLFRNNDQ
jgi:hypothetical protein